MFSLFAITICLPMATELNKGHISSHPLQLNSNQMNNRELGKLMHAKCENGEKSRVAETV